MAQDYTSLGVNETNQSFENSCSGERSRIDTGEDERSRNIPPPDLKATIISMAGNILEWYDFAIFGLFSDIIGDNFFAPDQKGELSLIEAFLIYALAFVARPIGGAILGKMGDMHGSKDALETSTFGMAFATFLIGCLPTYKMVGPLSTLLLTITRCLQGLALGGQLVSMILFTLEQRDPQTWGLWGAIVLSVSKTGGFVGSALAAVIRECLTEDQVEKWGWRIPFWLGACGALPALYLRLKVKDYGVNQSSQMPKDADKMMSGDMRKDPKENGIENETETDTDTDTDTEIGVSLPEQIESIQRDPLKQAFSKDYRRSLIASFLGPTLYQCLNYIVCVWFVIFMNTIVDPPIPHAFEVNSLNMVLVGVLCNVAAGWFVDLYGNHKRLMILCCIVCGISAPFAFALVGRGGTKHAEIIAFGVQFYLSMFLVVFSSALVPWLVESVPHEVRLTIISVGLNVNSIIWGGFTPLVATLLANKVSHVAPGYLLSLASILSIAGIYVVKPPIMGGRSIRRGDSNISDDSNTPLLS